MGYRHYSGLKGTKVLHVGSDTSAYEYQTIAAAVAAAQANDTIVLSPGTHTITAMVVINKPLRFIGLGGSGANGCKVTCSAALATSMFDIELVAQAAAAEVYFQDIYFIQADDNYDVFEGDNTTIAQNLTVTFQNCDIKVLDSASTGKAINFSHTTTTKAISVVVGSNRMADVGCINMTIAHNDDSIKVSGMVMYDDGNATAIITSAGNKTAGIELHGCQFASTLGASGGHASQTLKSYYSHDGAGVAASGDFTGDHTQTLVGS